MYSQRVRNMMEKKKLLMASPDMTVSAAAKLMTKSKVSAVMVLENDNLIGIFTERDAVSRGGDGLRRPGHHLGEQRMPTTRPLSTTAVHGGSRSRTSAVWYRRATRSTRNLKNSLPNRTAAKRSSAPTPERAPAGAAAPRAAAP